MLKSQLRRSAALSGLFVLSSVAALADDYSNAASYNHAYDMQAGQENATANPSLRDANGNLTVVNGQFTSSAVSQSSGAQAMSGISGSGTSLSNLGTHTSGAGFGGATAIGNQLNVVTVGNFNTVVVSSHQSNSGDQTATVDLNGSKTN
jgi:holdfast attachment protein HfaA